MDVKQRILSQTDQEILSLWEVKAKDEEIKGSEKVWIICLKGKIVNAGKENVPTQQHNEPAQVMAQTASRIRLPKLSFLKFRGDVTKWNTY